jgi:hypothetical protein
LEVKTAFCRHYWRLCYRKRLASKSQKVRKKLRKEMRKTAEYIVEIWRSCDDKRESL